jgi:hypothetical protein
MGEFYTMTIRWMNGMVTEFRDSAKKLPSMSVADVAEAFKMDEELGLSKGDLDYELERPVGWRITPEEADYVKRDVLIIARAMGQQLATGLHKLTAGSDALWEFKKTIGRDTFDRLFPVLSVSMDSEIRRAYRGGFTYASPRYSGRLVERHGKVFDVNSLYPYVMHSRLIPYGEPEFVSGAVEPTKLRPLTIQSITFLAKIKPDHIPCIQIKGTFRFSETEYLTEVDEPTTIMVTNVDLALMYDHYDVTVLEWGGGWRFTATTGIFDAYIDYWMERKAKSTGGYRTLCKLMLNSLYGKFATNPIVGGKYPVLDDDGVVRLKRAPDEERNPVYTAAGVFITSYARDITIRAAQENFDAFAYADTDSLHLFTETVPEGLRVHPSELGAWKHEYDFSAAYFVRAKAYFERTTDGDYHNAVAGIPKHISAALTHEDLVPGTEITVGNHGKTKSVRQIDPENGVLIHGKLTPMSVNGGVVLKDTPFKLKLAS